MSDFQEINEHGNYGEKVSEIASRLAINKYNSLKGRNVNLDFEISENEKVVSNRMQKGHSPSGSIFHPRASGGI